MGAWGPGIFENDTALDARDTWRDGLLAGEDPRALTERVVALFGDGGDDTDFWTGLAAAQHETGHLQDDVRERTLANIAAGGDLELWEDSDAEERERALQELAEKLRGPQPAPTTPSAPRPGPDPGVETGDVLRVWSSDRTRSVNFLVIAVEQVKGSRWPVLLEMDMDEDPIFLTIMVTEPGEEFRAEIGDVVARGVALPADAAEIADISDCGSWEALISEVDRRAGLPPTSPPEA